MVTAVFWDFGGVLTSSPFEAFNRYERDHGLPNDFIRTINATNPEANAWARFEASQVDLDEFDGLFADESAAQGYRVPGKDVIALLSGDLRPRMVRALKLCKERYPVACITNNVKSGHGPGMAASDERANAVAEVMALFDVVVQSSVEGVRKPDPAIYRLACERVGIEPDGVVYLDDLGINLKPARALGMTTIKVESEEQALEALEWRDWLETQLAAC